MTLNLISRTSGGSRISRVFRLSFFLSFLFVSGVTAQSPNLLSGARSTAVAGSGSRPRVVIDGIACDSSGVTSFKGLSVCAGVARYSNLEPHRVILETTLRDFSGSVLLEGGVLLGTSKHPCESDPSCIRLTSSVIGDIDSLFVGLSSETVYHYRSFTRIVMEGDTVTSYGLSGSFVTPFRCGFREIYAAGYCWMDRNLGDEDLVRPLGSLWASAGFPAAPALPSSSVGNGYGDYYNFNNKSTSISGTSGSGNWSIANDPCPAGYQVPSMAQLVNLNQGYSWDDQNKMGCFHNKAICLPVAGYRSKDGSIIHSGGTGYYWSTERWSDNVDGNYMWLNETSANYGAYDPLFGRSVRCVAKN